MPDWGAWGAPLLPALSALALPAPSFLHRGNTPLLPSDRRDGAAQGPSQQLVQLISKEESRPHPRMLTPRHMGSSVQTPRAAQPGSQARLHAWQSRGLGHCSCIIDPQLSSAAPRPRDACGGARKGHQALALPVTWGAPCGPSLWEMHSLGAPAQHLAAASSRAGMAGHCPGSDARKGDGLAPLGSPAAGQWQGEALILAGTCGHHLEPMGRPGQC